MLKKPNETKVLAVDLSGIINCNAFSMVPSIINKNVKNVLFHYLKEVIEYFFKFFFRSF